MIDRPDAPLGSPGCFGRAMSYRAGTPECDSCPFRELCEPQSVQRTSALRASLGIVAKTTGTPKVKARAPKAEPAAAMGMSLPRKVVDLIGRFERTGIRVTETLAAGKNPFVETPAFMRVVCHILLSKPQGVSRRYLTAALMHRFGWRENTATPHATQAVQALCALGAATESDGIVALRR